MKLIIAWLSLFVASASLAENAHRIETSTATSNESGEAFLAKRKPDICKNAWAAVCANRPTLVQARLDAAELGEQAFANAPGKSPSLPELIGAFVQAHSNAGVNEANATEARRQYGAFIKNVHSQVMDEWAKRGITEEIISQHVDLIKNLIAAGLKPDRGAAAVTRLRMAEIAWPQRIFSPGPDRNILEESFYRMCGFDGLVPGAFYDNNTNLLIVCPGLLSTYLTLGLGLEHLEFTISHELGHSFGPLSQVSPISGFGPFIECITKRYGKRLITPKKARDYMQFTGIEALKRELKRAESVPSPDEDLLLRLSRVIVQIQTLMPAMAWQEQVLNQAFPPKATAAQSHSSELWSDAIASEALAQLSKGKDARSSILTQLAYFCPKDAEGKRLAKLAIKKGDDGIHPPNQMRVEYILSNPNLRKVFGCQDTSPSSDWCAPL